MRRLTPLLISFAALAVTCANSAAQKSPPDKNHWAWQPIRPQSLPKVKNLAWCKTPIDRFILAKLESKGLKPSPEADRRTLIRRLSFDLTGLPPTREEVSAFVVSRDPKAYEKLVDRLLASPRYGERWARHWLDVVHYGDTHGYDKDKRRDNAWRYRDYVIRALNADVDYSQFIREQIAGDALWSDRPDAVIATGFVAAGPWDFVGHEELREGTVEKAKTRLLDRDDMVANTISTFNSVTVHCARCHDHKFDPIPQRDYYRLQACFAGVDRRDRPIPDDGTTQVRTNLDADLASAKAKIKDLEKQAASASKEHPVVIAIDQELAAIQEAMKALPPLLPGAPSATNGYHSAISPVAEAVKWVQLDLGASMPIDRLRLVPARPTDFPDTPGFGFPVRLKVEVSDDPTFGHSRIVLDATDSDYENPKDRPVIIPLANASARCVRVTATRLWPRTGDFVFALAELEVISNGRNVADKVTVTALDSIEAGRWSTKFISDGFDSHRGLPRASDGASAEALASLDRLRTTEASLSQRRAAAAKQAVPAKISSELDELRGEQASLEARIKQLPPSQMVYALQSHAPRPIAVLSRGNVEAPGEPVGPGGIGCVSGLSADFAVPEAGGEGARRVALADWIANPKNALTWRSIVNRVWHYHFGKGIVDTPNDFGKNGGRPSHPELLDWLAAAFRDGLPQRPNDQATQRSTRSLKSLHRMIVLSAAYRQSSVDNPEYAKIDGDNRLLWRMNRQRLDAESVRDSVLSVSGKLDLMMGGPGFELFRFKDDHSPVYDHASLEKINDPTGWRRSVYRFVVRSVPNPFLESLDCADPSINTPVRNTTLTALQALALLNDPFMIDQAEHFSRRLDSEGSDLDSQIGRAVLLAYGREPSPSEKTAMAAYARKHGLPALCRLLLNANEFVFID